jgi:ADP-ribosylation factor GTPase-activating protein 2/3
MVESS